ncbi:hypothetical protein B7463_g8964, partial [Scytalidium lignicola]
MTDPEKSDSSGNKPTAVDRIGIIEHASPSATGVDEALKYASDEPIIIDEATNRRLLHATDWHVLPWLCALYFMQYMDKGVLSYASVMGILKDAHLSNSQYTWLGSIYYFGYLAAAYPHNRLLQHFPQSKYIATCAFLWGVVLCTMAAGHNFAGLMCVRVFMGVLEATVNCGFVLVTAKWYRKYEHSSRVGIWAASNGFSTIVGGVVAYGCSRGSAQAGLTFHGWRILAVVTGGITIIFAVCMFFFMAENPIEARFFSEEDKTLAVECLRDNHQGVGSRQFKWYQFREAFTDVRTWIYVFFILSAQIPSGGTTLFSSLLIKSLNFDSNTTLLLAMPTGFVQICSNLSFGWLADKTKQRSLVAAGCHVINIFFIGLLVGLSRVGPLYERFGQLVAYFFIVGNGSTPYFIVISMISSNTLGYTKKTTVNGIVFTSMAAAYLIGPQIFRDGPYYNKAKDATIGLWVLAILLLLLLFTLNKRENKRRDSKEETGHIEHLNDAAFLDLTDKENKEFRYVL